VSRAVTIVLTFGPQQKAVQALVLSHGTDAIEPAGEHLVDISLVANIEKKSVTRRLKHTMQRDRELDHSKIRSKVAAGLRQNMDQHFPHFLSELWQIFLPQRLHVCRRMNRIE
jgi:hypothetical protein